jgi:hypothetical protein
MSWLPARPCAIVDLLDDGTPVVRIGDEEPRPLPVHGILVPQPPPDLYVEILTRRLGGDPTRLRCELPADPGRATARYAYLAWQDKTGDVWRDLGQLLLTQGAARPAPGDRR